MAHGPNLHSLPHTSEGALDTTGILDALAELRRALRERVSEVATMTESEVMATADSVHKIYARATAQISDLKNQLSRFTSNDSKNDTVGAIEKQLLAVEAYLREMDGRIDDQQRLSSDAASYADQIMRAAQEIQKLTARAHMLALNARIEATRTTRGDSHGFSVIAVEMKQLSTAIATTNTTIQKLARDMGAVLPRIDGGIREMRSQSRDFSEALGSTMRTLGEKTEQQRGEIAQALNTSDVTMGAIVEASQNALSHLQFQDAVAQGLMRLDRHVLETQVAICRAVAADDLISTLEPPMHVEIGGEKAVRSENAGEVMLF